MAPTDKQIKAAVKEGGKKYVSFARRCAGLCHGRVGACTSSSLLLPFLARPKAAVAGLITACFAAGGAGAALDAVRAGLNLCLASAGAWT